MNRRAFLSTVGLTAAALCAGRLSAQPSVRRSVSLTPDQYDTAGYFGLNEFNRVMTQWRRTYGRDIQPTHITLGRFEVESLMNLAWSSSFTREFCARATKEDYYRASHDYLHDQLRAKRGELWGIQIIHSDAEHVCVLT